MYKHKEVFNAIHEKIINGVWYEGWLLPSEADLCKMYSVSRITIRRALKELEDHKLVSKVQGKGTFVRASINNIIENNSYDIIRYEIKKITTQAPTTQIMEKLELSKFDNKVIYIEKLRYRNNNPEVIIHSWYPYKLGNLLTKTDLENNNTLELLAKVLNKPVVNIDTKLSPYIPTSQESSDLSIESNTAHAKIFRIAKNSDDSIVEYLEGIINSTELQFTVSSWDKK